MKINGLSLTLVSLLDSYKEASNKLAFMEGYDFNGDFEPAREELEEAKKALYDYLFRMEKEIEMLRGQIKPDDGFGAS